MSPHNVAIYGGLSALATFDRTELFKLVISSSQFKVSHLFFLLAELGKIDLWKAKYGLSEFSFQSSGSGIREG
jgi:hypothetical protein